jgi:pilus assembly protein CpaF
VPPALAVVDGEVRELIRRRGLDPFTDPGPVRVLVRDVVADYSECSLGRVLECRMPNWWCSARQAWLR